MPPLSIIEASRTKITTGVSYHNHLISHTTFYTRFTFDRSIRFYSFCSPLLYHLLIRTVFFPYPAPSFVYHVLITHIYITVSAWYLFFFVCFQHGNSLTGLIFPMQRYRLAKSVKYLCAIWTEFSSVPHRRFINFHSNSLPCICLKSVLLACKNWIPDRRSRKGRKKIHTNN